MRRQELSEYDKRSIREAEEYLDHQHTEEDPFFAEVAEILANIDRKSAHNYFDDILSEIPEDELPDTIDETFETMEDAEKRMDDLIAEQEKLNAKLAAAHKAEAQDAKHKRYLKSVEMEIMPQNYINLTILNSLSAREQEERDMLRINTLLTHIREQVRSLGVWSPAKNMYQKILNNKRISTYDKVQQLITAARRIHEKNADNTKGFVFKRLALKSAKIHEEIAGLDINSDRIITDKRRPQF